MGVNLYTTNYKEGVSKMNSKERVFNWLSGNKVDRVPNLNMIMQFAAKYINVPYGTYCKDYRYLVEGNIKCCNDFGIDMLSVISDPFRETSGFGANVIMNTDDVPSCQDHYIREYKDIKKLKIVNPSESERMLDRIKAVALYKETCGNDFGILGWIEGPFAEACDLRGLSNIMLDMFDEPEFVKELMEICLEQGILFAEQQILAGAEFIGIGDAAASLVGFEIYNDFIFPMQKKLINEIQKRGAKVKLHICGNTTCILDGLAQTGADIIDIDHLVDLKTAIDKIGSVAFVCGNFDPVSVLLQGNPDSVQQAVKNCIDIGKDRIFISAGCEIPKYTPHQNLKAVHQALVK
jgi:MtaA/CmuA family methyltransferase